MNRYVISWRGLTDHEQVCYFLTWFDMICFDQSLCPNQSPTHSSPLSACKSSFDHSKTISSLIKGKCAQTQVLKIQRCINLLLNIFSTTRSLDQLQVSYSQMAVTFSLITWQDGTQILDHSFPLLFSFIYFEEG